MIWLQYLRVYVALTLKIQSLGRVDFFNMVTANKLEIL